MKKLVLILTLILLMLVQITAQEGETPEDIALARIEEAARTGATELDLRWLGLTELPPDIGQLTNLKELYLSYNELTALPPEIGQLTDLETLSVGNYFGYGLYSCLSQQLIELSTEIGRLTNLTYLDLECNNLTALPPQIGQLTNLSELNLGRNNLTRLPAEIGQLTNLTKLDLRRNNLTALPPELCHLRNLETLSVDGNSFSPGYPHYTDGLLRYLCEQLTDGTFPVYKTPEQTALEWIEETARTAATGLDLHSWGLTELPPEIGQLTNLTDLDLGWNNLTELPPEIGQLTNLRVLDLEGNPLPEDFPCRYACEGSELEAIMEYVRNQENAQGETDDTGE